MWYRRLIHASLFFLVLGFTAAHLTAQIAVPFPWVQFGDQTNSRLVLQSFVDDPFGNPFLDDDEKDIAKADLNKDGWVDLVVVRKQRFSVPGVKQDLLLMNENGVLVDRTATLAPGFRNSTNLTDARDVYIGDFDRDGWKDVVIANTFQQQPKFYRNLGNGIAGWLGLADESFRFPNITTPSGILQFCAVWGGDVNKQHFVAHDDVLATAVPIEPKPIVNAPDLYFSNYSGTEDVLLINDGTGHFTDQTASRVGSYANSAFGTAAEIRDLDRDGDKDIIKITTLFSVPPFNTDGTFVLYNDGTGKFNSLPFQQVPATATYMFATGNLDSAVARDIYVVSDNQDFVHLASSVTPDGPITWNTTQLTNAQSPRTPGFGGNVKMGDIDNDGDNDVGVAPIDVDIANCPPNDTGVFALLRNNGSGGLTDPFNTDQNFHLHPFDFEFLDINKDGCTDIFMGLCTGYKVFIRTCLQVEAEEVP